MSEKDDLMRIQPKQMFLARKVGDSPISVFETMQYMNTKERMWETEESHMHPAMKCAIAHTEEAARNLIIWGPFVTQGSSNGRTLGFGPSDAGSMPAP